MKAVTLSTSSKKNLLYTVDVKQVLSMSRSIDCSNFIDNLIFDTKDVINESTNQDGKNIKALKKIKFNGITYECSMFIVTQTYPPKMFGKITHINYVGKNIFFTIESFEEFYFDSHFHSYIVERNYEKDCSLHIKSLFYVEATLSVVKNIAPRSHLICVRLGS